MPVAEHPDLLGGQAVAAGQDGDQLDELALLVAPAYGADVKDLIARLASDDVDDARAAASRSSARAIH